MTDSPILTPEDAFRASVGKLYNSHEALRAALAAGQRAAEGLLEAETRARQAAEERAERAERWAAEVQEKWQDALGDLTMSNARAVTAEAERDQAIAERAQAEREWASNDHVPRAWLAQSQAARWKAEAIVDHYERRGIDAEAQVRTLREFVQHKADCAYRPATCGCGDKWCPEKEVPCTCGLDAALGEKNDGT